MLILQQLLTSVYAPAAGVVASHTNQETKRHALHKTLAGQVWSSHVALMHGEGQGTEAHPCTCLPVYCASTIATNART